METKDPVEYVIYVDESGDHGLTNLNPEFPVFVLAFCIFKVSDYIEKVVPRVQRFKFRHFMHDMVILHERDIRRGSGYFTRLRDPKIKNFFIEELNLLIVESEFEIVSCVLDKQSLRNRGISGNQVYYLAARRGLEAVSDLLQKRLSRENIPVIFESRGKEEDSLLRSEFVSDPQGASQKDVSENYELVIASKKVNSTGLQLADMMARPLAQKWIKPNQNNRTYEIVESKLKKQIVIA